MKTMISANIYEYALQAVSQNGEYGYCEVRPSQGRQRLVGSGM